MYGTPTPRRSPPRPPWPACSRVGQAVDPDDRQHHIVANPGCGLGVEEVVAGGREERHDLVVGERGRVGDVEHDIGAGDGLGDAFSRDGVDAGRGEAARTSCPRPPGCAPPCAISAVPPMTTSFMSFSFHSVCWSTMPNVSPRERSVEAAIVERIKSSCAAIARPPPGHGSVSFVRGEPPVDPGDSEPTRHHDLASPIVKLDRLDRHVPLDAITRPHTLLDCTRGLALFQPSKRKAKPATGDPRSSATHPRNGTEGHNTHHWAPQRLVSTGSSRAD